MSTNVSIRGTAAGIEVVDAIHHHRVELERPAPAPVDQADPARFPVPVDAAATVAVERLTVPTVVPIYVRDSTGRMLAEVEHHARERFPDGSYLLELCTPVKCYLAVDGPLVVEASLDRMRLDFGAETPVVLGARSYHDRPAATVTVTPDPADVMAGVSTFGSALKTTSPERSFPTLRGHPPTLAVGDSLDVPSDLDEPETGVRIDCPSDLGSVFAVASLAFYLGAEVAPASSARLVTDRGLDLPLGGVGRDLETAVERVLQQVFFLDCLVRTGGLYEVRLHEREVLESRLDLDVDAAYAKPIDRRLAAYLDVPFEVVADELPAWQLTSYLEPNPDGIEVLPYLVDDLAFVREPDRRRLDDSALGRVVADALRFEEGPVRSAASTTPSVDALVNPPRSDSLEQVWVADGVPIGASKVTVDAYRNRLDRAPTTDDISVTVVCTDGAMVDEQSAVEAVYGSRPDRPFAVDVHLDPTVDGLRDVLARETGFLHFIGHVDDEGIVCGDDERIDVRSLERVGADCFLLNGCRSYEQGLGLVEAGAVGGIVTVGDVVNRSAVELGETLARLLNRGFPIRSALEIAWEHDRHSANYVTVGDGGVAIAQAESGTPNIYDVRRDGDGYVVEITAYPPKEGGMGSLFFPYLAGNETHFLGSGSLEPFAVTREELRRFFALEDVPVRLDGELRWSGELEVDEL